MHIGASIIRGIRRIFAVPHFKGRNFEHEPVCWAYLLLHRLNPTQIIKPPTKSALEEGKHLFIGCLVVRGFTSENLLMLHCHFMWKLKPFQQSIRLILPIKANIKMLK